MRAAFIALVMLFGSITSALAGVNISIGRERAGVSAARPRPRLPRVLRA